MFIHSNTHMSEYLYTHLYIPILWCVSSTTDRNPFSDRLPKSHFGRTSLSIQLWVPRPYVLLGFRHVYTLTHFGWTTTGNILCSSSDRVFTIMRRLTDGDWETQWWSELISENCHHHAHCQYGHQQIANDHDRRHPVPLISIIMTVFNMTDSFVTSSCTTWHRRTDVHWNAHQHAHPRSHLNVSWWDDHVILCLVIDSWLHTLL